MRKLCWDFTPSSVLSLLLLLISFPLAFLLLPEWAKENGPIEWAQAVLLAMGSIIAVAVYFSGTSDLASRRLFLCSVPVWLTLIGRELSWGRVFYPIGAGSYLPLKQLWYGPYVYPGIAAVFALVVWIMVQKGLHKVLANWLRNGRLPAIDGLILITAIITAELAEHRLAGLIGPRHVVIEELAETVVYYTLLSITVNLGFYSAFQPKASQAVRMKRSAARNL